MIKFVIEIVIAFVIQALDQINFTIASTSESDPLSLCMYMHRSTLVYIYTYMYIYIYAYTYMHTHIKFLFDDVSSSERRDA